LAKKEEKNPDFQNLLNIKCCWRQIFELLIIHKPSLWSFKVLNTKFGPDRFRCFYVYWYDIGCTI